jgi:hypothetical protein
MNRKLFHSQSLINARVVILSEAKDLRRNPCLTPIRLIHHTTLSFRAKRGICFLTPYQKPVILSEARRERRPDVSIHGAATPISIFQFPFSTLPGGTAKP